MRKLPPPPLAHSYWVERGRLLAGEHPCAGSESARARRLQLLMAAGVRTFIDLTHEGEMPDYRPLLPESVNVHRMPIPDHSVPEKAGHMHQIQRVLARELEREEGAVYVHCRAGYGRTGITIGCYLRECGQEPRLALAELNRLWQDNARSSVWPRVPETDEQERYILEWIAKGTRAPAA
jgi:hypothetical protein